MKRLFVLVAAGFLILTACGSDDSPTIEGAGDGGEAAECGQPTSRVTVVTKSIAGFEPECVSVPAGIAFTIVVDNPDAGVSHNLALFEDMAMTMPLPKSEIAAGPNTMELKAGPLAAGIYHFHCDVHPTTMEGELKVA